MPRTLPPPTAHPDQCPHPEAEVIGWGKKHGRPMRICQLCHSEFRLSDLADLRSTSASEASGELALILFSSVDDYDFRVVDGFPELIVREGVHSDAMRAVRAVRFTPYRLGNIQKWGMHLELHPKGPAILQALQLHGLLKPSYSKELEELILAVCENRPDLLRRVVSGENAISVIKDALAGGGVM